METLLESVTPSICVLSLRVTVGRALATRCKWRVPLLTNSKNSIFVRVAVTILFLARWQNGSIFVVFGIASFTTVYLYH